MVHLRWPANKRSLSPPPPSGKRSRSSSAESPSHKRTHRRSATPSHTPLPLHQSSPDYSSPAATSPSPSPAKAAFRERERPLFRPEPDSSDSEEEYFQGFHETMIGASTLRAADVEMEDCKPFIPSSPPAAEVTHVAVSCQPVMAEAEGEILAEVKEEDEDSIYGARRPGETYEVELLPVVEAPTPVTPSTSPTTSRTQPKPINNRFVFNFPPVPVASSSPLQTPPSTQRRTPAEIAALREAAKSRLEATKRRNEQLVATPIQPTPPLRRPRNPTIPPPLASTIALHTPSTFANCALERKPPLPLFHSTFSDTAVNPVLVRPHLHPNPPPPPLAPNPIGAAHSFTILDRAIGAGPFDALSPPRSKCETFLRFAAEAFAEAGGVDELTFLEQAHELVALAVRLRNLESEGSAEQGLTPKV